MTDQDDSDEIQINHFAEVLVRIHVWQFDDVYQLCMDLVGEETETERWYANAFLFPIAFPSWREALAHGLVITDLMQYGYTTPPGAKNGEFEVYLWDESQEDHIMHLKTLENFDFQVHMKRDEPTEGIGTTDNAVVIPDEKVVHLFPGNNTKH